MSRKPFPVTRLTLFNLSFNQQYRFIIEAHLIEKGDGEVVKLSEACITKNFVFISATPFLSSLSYTVIGTLDY